MGYSYIDQDRLRFKEQALFVGIEQDVGCSKKVTNNS